MNTAFVTGQTSSVARKLIHHLGTMNMNIVIPTGPDDPVITQKAPEHPAPIATVPWNRVSWFSARNLVRDIKSRYGYLDSCWIIHEPPNNQEQAREFAGTRLDRVLDHSIRGTVALVHEIQGILDPQHSFMAFIVPYSGTNRNPVDALSLGAFKYYARSLIQTEMQQYQCAAFISHSPDTEGFTSEILKLWQTRPRKLPTRWIHFPPPKKFSLFNKTSTQDS